MATSTKRFSIGGLVAASVTALIAVLGIAAVLRNPRISKDLIFTEIGFLVPAIAILLRAFRPPIGWKKGLAVWFGGLFSGVSPAAVLSPYFLRGGRLEGSDFFVFLIFFIPGVLLLRRGFKRDVPAILETKEA